MAFHGYLKWEGSYGVHRSAQMAIKIKKKKKQQEINARHKIKISVNTFMD